MAFLCLEPSSDLFLFLKKFQFPFHGLPALSSVVVSPLTVLPPSPPVSVPLQSNQLPCLLFPASGHLHLLFPLPECCPLPSLLRWLLIFRSWLREAITTHTAYIHPSNHLAPILPVLLCIQYYQKCILICLCICCLSHS